MDPYLPESVLKQGSHSGFPVVAHLSLLHRLPCSPFRYSTALLQQTQNAKGNIIVLKLVTSILILTILALALVPTRHPMTKALAILLITMRPPTSTSTLIHSLLHVNSPFPRFHLFIHVILKTMRIPRLHSLHRFLSFRLVFPVIVTIQAVTLAGTVFLALETLAVQLQTPALLAVARDQPGNARRRRARRFGGLFPRECVLEGVVRAGGGEEEGKGGRLGEIGARKLAGRVEGVAAVAALDGGRARERGVGVQGVCVGCAEDFGRGAAEVRTTLRVSLEHHDYKELLQK